MKEPAKVARLGALLYALSAWTMIGYICHLHGFGTPVPRINPEDEGVVIKKSKTFFYESVILSKGNVREEHVTFINPFRKDTSQESKKGNKDLECIED